jgi:hypothetical protein
MTLAPDERAENCREALKLMLERVGDEPVDEIFFGPKDLEGVLTTSLDDLHSRNFIEEISPGGEFSLTGRGWTAALLVTGANSEKTLEERIGKLFSTMKGLVKGRHEPAVVRFRTLVAEIDLPEGWVFNIIEGKYMEEVCRRKGASWFKKGRLVLIPVGFGVEPSDLQTLLNADLLSKVEGLEEELDATRDALGQYTCPYCGAGLSSAGPVELDEHTDGYFQVFTCGYSCGDGYEERLCPSDPKFPKLEDFELKVHLDKYGEWICHPISKTPNARKVGLGSQPGRTEEEAKQRVIDRYNYVSKKRLP